MNTARLEHVPAIPRGARRLPAVLLALLAIGLLAPGSAFAQLQDDSSTSTLGTQFIKPPPQPEKTPPPPPQTPPPAQAPLPAAAQPAKSAPPRPAPPAPFPSVVFLVDTSDSMLNRPAPARPTRLEEAKGALIQVLRKMTPEARVQVWSFNTRMAPVPVDGVGEGRFIAIGKGNHREQLIEQVRGLRTAGGTNLYSSVVKALAFFGEPRDQALYRAGRRYPVLVVVSDGEDGGKTQETLKTVQEEKGRHPLVTVNTIGFALDREQQWFEVLCRIATRPEGCATADDGAQLQTMLESFYRPHR